MPPEEGAETVVRYLFGLYTPCTVTRRGTGPITQEYWTYGYKTFQEAEGAIRAVEADAPIPKGVPVDRRTGRPLADLEGHTVAREVGVRAEAYTEGEDLAGLARELGFHALVVDGGPAPEAEAEGDPEGDLDLECLIEQWERARARSKRIGEDHREAKASEMRLHETVHARMVALDEAPDRGEYPPCWIVGDRIYSREGGLIRVEVLRNPTGAGPSGDRRT